MVKAAVIGAGQIAQQHLACLASLPGVSLEGVCDLSRSLAEYSADRHGVKAAFTDYKLMLSQTRPDMVHITTPVGSHFRLAQDCLNAGANVLVEKPATAQFEEFKALQETARTTGRIFLEDYNYLFNEPVLRLREKAAKGVLGALVHVEVVLCLNVLGKDSVFIDPNLRHPALDAPGGVIGDFLPHMASLAHFFCGSARNVQTLWKKDAGMPHGEFRAQFEGARATGSLMFSAASQPDAFRVTVYGSKGRAMADIYEDYLTVSWMRPVAKPLIPFHNAREEAKTVGRSAWRLLFRKLGSGPGAYEGLWRLIAKVYEGLKAGSPMPYSAGDMLEVNRLVDALKDGSQAA